MKRVLLLALMLGACGREPATAVADSAGARLEAAAETAGIVPDPNAPLQGSWARDTDRVCVVGIGKTARIGVSIDYGEDQACAASGAVERSGDALKLAFGTCKFDARFDGDRIVFPAEVPEACESLCTGRASLAALTVDRLSESRSEAATLRSTKGKLLCGN
ncbi:hypothetical protein C8J46_10132 [Sphingomonas sp. PP-F2F-A104-K0414]|uniref:hypothetical protein n=1 Tax=Sphingomonas sp. PP-F2F-A104-K0414 TaxID=2135661 RepID=UPI001049DF78|nr:hypothetical protein [Sphingomonas sp. PP-F2F-A104-K0414]TCQ00680.1 hypothetical protein C8J46_10132 [Sphingomonas sp. PP-F2F-A104-K0414]